MSLWTPEMYILQMAEESFEINKRHFLRKSSAEAPERNTVVEEDISHACSRGSAALTANMLARRMKSSQK